MSITPLRDLIDQARPELEPLNAHYMAVREPIAKDRYLTLLAASLLEEGCLSEAQSRVFGMLTASMAVNKPFSFFVQQVAKLDKTELKEIVKQLKVDEKASNAYLFDMMVLLRINGTLNNKQTWKITQQSSMLFVSNERIQNMVFWCMLMLIGELGDFNKSGLEVMIKTKEHSTKMYYESVPFESSNKVPYSVGDICQERDFYIHHKYSDSTGILGYHNYHSVSHPAGVVTDVLYDGGTVRTFTTEGHEWVVMKLIPFPLELMAWGNALNIEI